jgi:hypothetical protein
VAKEEQLKYYPTLSVIIGLNIFLIIYFKIIKKA